MQKITCSISGCEFDKAYAVTDLSGTKFHRISFSKSLCEYLVKMVPDTWLVRVKLILGKVLAPLDKSATGLYAVCKAKNNWPLRITFFGEAAESWRDDSRIVRECFIKQEGICS